MAAMSATIVSCGDDEIEPVTSEIPDPEGTRTLYLSTDFVNIGNSCNIKWVQPNNIQGEVVYTESDVAIVSLGKKKGLGDVNTSYIPEYGWQKEIACEINNAYIARYHQYWSSYGREERYLYCAFYIVGKELNGYGSYNYKIKSCPFSKKGWNTTDYD